MDLANRHVGGAAEHPRAEQLAQYVDGTLIASEVSAVEGHLAACQSCRDVLADTVSFLVSEKASVSGAAAPSARVAWRWIAGAAAVAAVLVVAVQISPGWRGRWLRGDGDRDGLNGLVQAMANEPTRPLEGRLSGGFKYAAAPVTRGVDARDRSPDVRIAIGEIEKKAQSGDSPGDLAALGAGYAVLGDWDKAVSALERATAGAPRVSSYWSDLSAVYLERARRGRSEDVQRSLRAADTALALSPKSEEACFNRALASTAAKLGVSLERERWTACVRPDDDPGWQAEVRRRLAEVERDARP